MGSMVFDACVVPSAAQLRVHCRLAALVRTFLRGSFEASGEGTITKFLRLDFAYGETKQVLPLGLRAGVPPSAASADTAAILERVDKEMAEQVRRPGAILLPPLGRPEKLPRPFVRKDSTYPEYVRRNCKSGLQRLAKSGRVFKHRVKVSYSGAFAVPKDLTEDRAISALCPLYSLVDTEAVGPEVWPGPAPPCPVHCVGQAGGQAPPCLQARRQPFLPHVGGRPEVAQILRPSGSEQRRRRL